MEKKQTISEWEKETGRFLLEENKSEELLTRGEFAKIAPLEKTLGVDYEFRVKFLEDNDYAVTRENLMNAELSARSQDDEEATADQSN